MSATNYLKKTLLLAVLLLSACQFTRVAQPPPPDSSGPVTAAPSQPSKQTGNDQQPPSKPNEIFQSILPELEEKTKLNPLLPGYVPEDESAPIYAVLESANPENYQIILGYTEDCNGGNACRLGTTSAETVTSETEPLVGEQVTLVNGISGYFVEADCSGANCSDATLSWEQNGDRYTVGIKAGKQETLVKMANSAIAASEQ